MNKQKITDIIANSTLWEIGKDGHNALSELVESLIKYWEQEIKAQKAIAFREGWEMLEQKLSLDNIEWVLKEQAAIELLVDDEDVESIAEAIHKLTKE